MSLVSGLSTIRWRVPAGWWWMPQSSYQPFEPSFIIHSVRPVGTCIPIIPSLAGCLRPAELFSNLNYDIMVAEMLPGQSAAKAILYNTPVYTNHNLRVPFENYLLLFSIKKDQAYAWQVVAKKRVEYAVQTETWSFVIKTADSAAVPVTGDGFVLLRHKMMQVEWVLSAMGHFAWNTTHSTKRRKQQ